MEVLVDRVMLNLVSVRLKRVLVSVQIGAWFAPSIPQAQKSFWTHPMELTDDVRHVESRFGVFGDSISVGAR
jgi:hypothetical protein